MNDEGFTDLDQELLDKADELYHVRLERDRLFIAVQQAASGFWKAADLQHSVPPEHLHRLLIWHRDLARNALERIEDVR
jgi:hypothetical protein